MTGPKRPWHRAVADGNAPEDQPANAEEAVRAELANLWHDLDEAVRMAYRGGWSVGCDNVAARIIRLSRLAAPASWQNVPITMLITGTYQGLLTDAGIEHDEPGENEMREMRALADSWRDAARPLTR